MKQKHSILSIVLFVLMHFALSSMAQTSYSSTQEMEKGADALFNNQNYIEAFPLYSQLLSLNIENPELNYRFGVCLLYADRSDTYAPIKYLKKAINHVSDPDLYYHLGFAYHINYYFQAAISTYTLYKDKAGRSINDSFGVNRKIEMCQNGMEMMRSVKELLVLEKSEVARDGFFKSYTLQGLGVRIINKPDEYLTKSEKKNNAKGILFFNPKSDYMYYSSYQDAKKNQKDIYVRHKGTDGEWGSPTKLPSIINTAYDEDFPVIMPDGKTLYFCSKGHNTIGGYDIFKTEYISETANWTAPVNINFPFNTPLDDVLYIPDPEESTAWFASVRNSVDGKIMVYKVGVIDQSEGSSNLATIYNNNRELTEEDVRIIKQRAQLNVNISAEDYDNIPASEEGLMTNKGDEQGDKFIEIELKRKRKEKEIIDSAMVLIDKLESNIDDFNRTIQSANSLAISKRNEAELLRLEIKRNLEYVYQLTEPIAIKELIDKSNKSMVKAERLEYEVVEIEELTFNLKQDIKVQKEEFLVFNKQYGDVEAFAIEGDSTAALEIISQMETSYNELPQLAMIPSDIEGKIKIEDLATIQYPAEIQNTNSFMAFVVSEDQSSGEITVESFSAKYDEYIPQKIERDLSMASFPEAKSSSAQIQIYIDHLNLQAKQLGVQEKALQEEIMRIEGEFVDYPESEKEEMVGYLNDLVIKQEDTREDLSNYEQISEDINSQYQLKLNMDITENEKEKGFENIVLAAEANYDFDKNILKPSLDNKKVNTAVLYELSSTGELEIAKKGIQEKNDAIEKLSFNVQNKERIMQQMMEMRSQMRFDNKANSFVINSIKNNSRDLKEEAQKVFNEANVLISTAKKKLNNQQDIINKANNEFQMAKNKQQDAILLAVIAEEMELADEKSNQQLVVMSTNNDKIIDAIEKEQWDIVERLYGESEAIYNEHLSDIDFSDNINMETGELIEGEREEETNFMAYEISENRTLEKNFGSITSDWNDIEEFTQDVIPMVKNNVSPTIGEQYENIAVNEGAFQQEQINYNESNTSELTSNPKTQSFIMPVLAVPLLISQSDNEIVKSALLSVQELQNETDISVKKRNQINTYYQETNKKAMVLEQESQQLLNKPNATEADLLEAKQKSNESELLFAKASESAKIIAEYDDELLEQTELIHSSINELNQIEELLRVDNLEQVEYRSQQLQDNVSNTDPLKVDDSQFDYVASVFIGEPINTGGKIHEDNNESVNESVEFVDLHSYLELDFANEQAIEEALSVINTYSQNQNNSVVNLQNALIIKAEEKLELSNKMSIEAEKTSGDTDKIEKQKLTKQYLFEALAIKRLSEDFEIYANEEMLKQMQISKVTFEIQEKLKQNELEESKAIFNEMIIDIDHFGAKPELFLSDLNRQMLAQNESLSLQMDSAYTRSQDLANESVKLLNEAADERKIAEGKRNAFKRRKLLTKVENKEIKATKIQQESDLALAHGNDLYFQKQSNAQASFLDTEIASLINTSHSVTPIIAANREIVFESIENRKQEILYGQFNTSKEAPLVAKDTNEKGKTNLDISKTKDTVNSLRSYEREVFKAQIITEELELIKREIALLLTTDKSELSDREIYILESNIKILRQSSDSIEYQANKAYVYANSILELLTVEEQKEATVKGRDFEDYLNDLKTEVEVLLSQASSLKKRAQRSNNLDERVTLFGEAKAKETIAIYLILEEFEVIAQKNKTRYRKNKLVLLQMMMESASPEEKDLMATIFLQIDNYFYRAQEKRDKARDESLSFNMRKILLQDAYSLEMRALDLQQQAKTMLEDHDVDTMQAYQPKETTETLAVNNEDNINTSKQENTSAIDKGKTNNELVAETKEQVAFVTERQGLIYKVQIMALKELKSVDFFKGVPEITAQRVENSSFIRYFSGDFSQINEAMIRRNSVRVSGYPDAFIKRWENGLEVSLLSSEEIGQQQDVSLTVNIPQARIRNIDFSATSISSLQGVYYSVQVGVYSRPRTSSMIFGISPLYHKRANNGYWIYFSGIYKTIADANVRKGEIVNKGVKDAFIVAFSNGEKVSLTQAREDIRKGEAPPLQEDIVILEDASLEIDKQWNNAQNTKGTLIQTSDDLTYRIQIGVYSNNVDLSWISSQLDDELILKSFQNSKGKYVFTLGDFNTTEEAKARLAEVIDITPDAFIVGFKGDEKFYIQ